MGRGVACWHGRRGLLSFHSQAQGTPPPVLGQTRVAESKKRGRGKMAPGLSKGRRGVKPSLRPRNTCILTTRALPCKVVQRSLGRTSGILREVLDKPVGNAGVVAQNLRLNSSC